MADVVTLPRGEKYIMFNWSNDEVFNIVSDFCGDEFARGLYECMNDLECCADYEKLKFNSDMEAYEVENETFRSTLQEIESLLQQYECKIERGEKRFTRADVWKLFDEIHDLINEVV